MQKKKKKKKKKKRDGVTDFPIEKTSHTGEKFGSNLQRPQRAAMKSNGNMGPIKFESPQPKSIERA